MIRVRKLTPTEAHGQALKDIKEVILKHKHLSAMELLALASQVVGNLIAFQDQTKVSMDMAMRVVEGNIAEGNLAAIEGMMNPMGNA